MTTGDSSPRLSLRCPETGAVLVVVLLAMIALLGLGLTGLYLTSGSIQMNSNINMRNQALYVAEAGIQTARSVLNRIPAGNPTWTPPLASMLSGTDPGGNPVALPTGINDEIPWDPNGCLGTNSDGTPGRGAYLRDNIPTGCLSNTAYVNCNYPNYSSTVARNEATPDNNNPVLTPFMGQYTLFIRQDLAECRQGLFTTENYPSGIPATNGIVVIRSEGVASDSRTKVVLEVTMSPNSAATPVQVGVATVCPAGAAGCDDNASVQQGLTVSGSLTPPPPGVGGAVGGASDTGAGGAGGATGGAAGQSASAGSSGTGGVGKTSLGKSIARALGRKYARISLGGVHDESEVRGHRRTYVGAMPGRIVQALHQIKSMNPVIMLDEVDKIGRDMRGDPSAALLEVLDPEQNHTFRDHYLNVPLDLSQVLFLANANELEPIHPAFRDRMEVIYLSSYTLEEKIGIAEQHLIPKQLEKHGVTRQQVAIPKKALKSIITGYTREAGLRQLEREIGAVCRKVARRVAENRLRKRFTLDDKSIHELLGPVKFLQDERLKAPRVGVVTGLAWTAVGGDVLFVEALKMPGKGLLTLTGQLGDVMKESAQAALSYIRSRGEAFQIDPEVFQKQDIHVHFPEGAIPKDGPSAGLAIATVLLSVLKGIPVRNTLAMTGEIDLRGEALAIGVLKEKSLAALRVGIKDILIPHANQKDLEEIDPELRKQLRFHPVKHVEEVFEYALVGWKRPEIVKSARKR